MGYFNTDYSTYSTSLFGRTKILYDVPNRSLSKEELLKIINYTLPKHLKNASEIDYLYNYYRGNQPILNRSNKNVRPEINNKTVENWAKKIVDFKTGFIWGEPVQLIKNSNKTDKEDKEDKNDKGINLLSDYFQECGKHKKDKNVGFWCACTGVGYLAVLPNNDEELELPFNLYSLDPRTTYIIYSDDFKKEPMIGVTFTKKGDNSYKFTIYTKYESFVFEASGTNDLNVDPDEYFEVKMNTIKRVPIVEFNYNETLQGGFEPVLPLLDNLNLLCSDRMNDVEQSVQWFMKFINVDIDEELYERFKSKGVIVVKSEPGNPANVDVVTTSLNQTQIQVYKDDMIRCIQVISCIPERNADPGDNTGQALIVGQGWADAEADASNVVVLQSESQKQLLDIAIRICRNISNVPQEVKKANLFEIDIKYTRNRSENLLIKTQALTNMLNSGVAPILAFKICGLFSDPQKAYELSRPYIEKFYEKGNKQDNKQDFDKNANNSFNNSEKEQNKIEKEEKDKKGINS